MRVRGAGRVAFLGLRPTIAAELAAGWPMAEVFRRHKADLGIAIGQFRAYVKLYIAPEQRWTGEAAAAVPPGGRGKARPGGASPAPPGGVLPPDHPLGQPQARGPDLTAHSYAGR
jgi:hypothetical protein